MQYLFLKSKNILKFISLGAMRPRKMVTNTLKYLMAYGSERISLIL